MTESISKTSWVYAIIQNPEKSEELLGFTDENNIKYIPAVKSKEEAEDFMSYIPREPGTKYEAQAIIYEDLLKYASENLFLVYIVDKKGKIVDKIDPNVV